MDLYVSNIKMNRVWGAAAWQMGGPGFHPQDWKKKKQLRGFASLAKDKVLVLNTYVAAHNHW